LLVECHRKSSRLEAFRRYVEMKQADGLSDASDKELSSGPMAATGIDRRHAWQYIGDVELADVHVGLHRTVAPLRRCGTDRHCFSQ
jgi:hypothetical protein